jgi:GT2 family glycosyltransferase
LLRLRKIAFTAVGMAALRDVYRRRYSGAKASQVFKHVMELAARESQATDIGPLAGPQISFVVPVFNTKPAYLDDLFQSLQRQIIGSWRLILSDDGSTSPKTLAWLSRVEGQSHVTILRNSVNRGIAAATNAGIEAAETPWIGLLDHDDAIAPYAVEQILKAWRQFPNCQFIYTDEVVTDGRLWPMEFFLKPAWDPILLSGVNYINHLSLYRRTRLLEIGGLREGLQGSQDYDLVLRYTRGLAPDAICHLPYPAYLWRRDGATHSVKFVDKAVANARRALADHFAPSAADIEIDEGLREDRHRVRFDRSMKEWPLVSVIIPNRNSYALIKAILEGLTQKTHYSNMEIIVIDNGSDDERVLALYREFEAGPTPFSARIENEPFNFSRSVNRGAELAKGSHLLLLNNDIEVVDPGWLEEMASCFRFDNVGVVGAKLLYPDGTLQHAGVIAGLGGYAGHWFIGREADFPGPMGRLWVRQSLSVVTGACMLVSKTCWRTIGPFDETVFPIAYNDVDFCLRAIEHGFRVVWTPFASLVHHESASRGSDETQANIERFNRDKAQLQARHRTDVYDDPAFSPWYSRHHSYPQIVQLDRLPPARSGGPVAARSADVF